MKTSSRQVDFSASGATFVHGRNETSGVLVSLNQIIVIIIITVT